MAICLHFGILTLAFCLLQIRLNEGLLFSRCKVFTGSVSSSRFQPWTYPPSIIHKSTEKDDINATNSSEFSVVKPLQVGLKDANTSIREAKMIKTVRERKAPGTFIGTESDQSFGELLASYFVPGSVAIWAVGYGAVFLIETQGDGLGDIGGYLGAGLACLLLFSLMAAAIFEIVKPTDSLPV
jgi:hypothetical protein